MLKTEFRDLALDQYNNLIVGTDLSFTTGIAGVVQACRIKLSMFKGEWFLDRTKGIDYWGQILGEKPDVAISAMTSAFYGALMSVEDVTSVAKLNITYTRSSRQCFVDFAVQCRFGESPTSRLQLAV